MKHNCEGYTPNGAYGDAIDSCYSTEDRVGELWVSNGEYASRVNFCPYCGAKADKQMVFVKNQYGQWEATELHED